MDRFRAASRSLWRRPPAALTGQPAEVLQELSPVRVMLPLVPFASRPLPLQDRLTRPFLWRLALWSALVWRWSEPALRLSSRRASEATGRRWLHSAWKAAWKSRRACLPSYRLVAPLASLLSSVSAVRSAARCSSPSSACTPAAVVMAALELLSRRRAGGLGGRSLQNHPPLPPPSLCAEGHRARVSERSLCLTLALTRGIQCCAHRVEARFASMRSFVDRTTGAHRDERATGLQPPFVCRQRS